MTTTETFESVNHAFRVDAVKMYGVPQQSPIRNDQKYSRFCENNTIFLVFTSKVNSKDLLLIVTNKGK